MRAHAIPERRTVDFEPESRKGGHKLFSTRPRPFPEHTEDKANPTRDLKDAAFLGKRAITIRTAAQVRQESLQAQDPNFEIPENQLQVLGSLGDRLETRINHAVQLIIGLMRRGEFHHQIPDVGQSG